MEFFVSVLIMNSFLPFNLHNVIFIYDTTYTLTAMKAAV
jgi:hypothetical protein